MNKLLKALFVGIGLLVSFSTSSAFIYVPIVHSDPLAGFKWDKVSAVCNYAQSDVIPDGFGCKVKDGVIPFEDFARREGMKDRNLRAYIIKRDNVKVQVLIEVG